MALISDICRFNGGKRTTSWVLLTKTFQGPLSISESGHLFVFHCIMTYCSAIQVSIFFLSISKAVFSTLCRAVSRLGLPA